MAEGFFKHISEFMQKYSGWIDENHAHLIMGLFLKGIKVYREHFGNHKQQLWNGTFVYAD